LELTQRGEQIFQGKYIRKAPSSGENILLSPLGDPTLKGPGLSPFWKKKSRPKVLRKDTRGHEKKTKSVQARNLRGKKRYSP